MTQNDLTSDKVPLRSYSLTPVSRWRYWRQRADERLGDHPPRYPGAFNGQRQGWKTPKRTPGGALLEDLLWVSRSMERDLSCRFVLDFLACIHCVSSIIMLSLTPTVAK